jgi:hypothetical protein
MVRTSSGRPLECRPALLVLSHHRASIGSCTYRRISNRLLEGEAVRTWQDEISLTSHHQATPRRLDRRPAGDRVLIYD